MRKLAAVLMLVAVAPTLVLGGMFLLASRFQAISAEIESQDLSSVASDLVSPEQLAKERQAANKRLDKHGSGRGGRQLALAVLLLASGVSLLVAGILALIRRARRLVVAIACGALAAVIATLALEGFNLLGGAAALALLIAALAALPARGWQRDPPGTTSGAA